MNDNNWGRWGDRDERGAVNFLKPERICEAAALVRQGQTVSLGMPIGAETPAPACRVRPSRLMERDGGDYAAGARRPGGFQFAEDVLILSTHTGTHMDALAHVWYDDQLYNGFSGNSIDSRSGARHCGIDKVGPVVGRGVLLDIARHLQMNCLPGGHAIGPEVLEACARGASIALREGDVVLFRTAWMPGVGQLSDYYGTEPGLNLEAAHWLASHGVALVGSDNYAIEVLPSGGATVFPVHQALLRDYGIPLLEGLNLDELSQHQIAEFLFVACPLPILGGTASPVNPVAIF
ncbi:MAG: cyclase family protein [Ardenticatenaceae bacterium]|nr:cyclase family protein [Ardenticatenaceae bacterium]